MLGSVYDRLRRWVPYRGRQWIKSQAWFVPLAKLIFRHDVYSRSYYEDVERLEGESVEHIGDWIVRELRPGAALDVGCGPGHLMHALHRRGVSVRGVDISAAALRRVRERGLKAEPFDLTDPQSRLPGGPYDLVICCEVAEHLEAKHAATLARKLAAAGRTLYMTAAEPKPGAGVGLYHFNEQPNSYWINLMKVERLTLDEPATRGARECLKKNGVVDYLSSPMVFRRD